MRLLTCIKGYSGTSLTVRGTSVYEPLFIRWIPLSAVVHSLDTVVYRCSFVADRCRCRSLSFQFELTNFSSLYWQQTINLVPLPDLRSLLFNLLKQTYKKIC